MADSGSHFEISPGEKDDEQRFWEYEFGVDELSDEELRDRIRRAQEGPPEDG